MAIPATGNQGTRRSCRNAARSNAARSPGRIADRLAKSVLILGALTLPVARAAADSTTAGHDIFLRDATSRHIAFPAEGGDRRAPHATEPGETFALGNLARAESLATDEVVVRLAAGVDAAAIAAAHGLVVGDRFQSDEQTVVLRAPSVAAAETIATLLATDPAVETAVVNHRSAAVGYATPFIPNDPYFARNTPVAPWPGQWHLANEVTPGLDARVTGAWNAGWTGAGVAIGIIDDGVQMNHPDLVSNLSAALSFNFGSASPDPGPSYATDSHGTSVAGVAAARGGNGIGVTGAAPFATLASLRQDFAGNGTSQQFADATLYLSSGTNTSIAIKNHSYGIPAPFIMNAGVALEVAAASTSAAAGTIHVWSAGNSRGTAAQDANKGAYQANPDVITVAAMGSDGTWSHYSSFGSNVFVTAPSSSSKGVSGATGITTTDQVGTIGYNSAETGDTFPDNAYTSRFGGTSSSAPLVAGVLALAKEAQPALDGRFAKHLLARTSVVVDPDDATGAGGGDGSTPGSAWQTNAAGYQFNMNYGFGMVDATALIEEAMQYVGTTPLEMFSTGTLAVNQPVTNLTGVVQTYAVAGLSLPLEEVLVWLDVTHAYRGDLDAFLLSPGGTVSRLMASSGADSAANLNWTFTTNAFWGESANGTWSLLVRDVFPTEDDGTWNSWEMTLRTGTLVAVPEPATWVLAGAGLAIAIGCRRRARS